MPYQLSVSNAPPSFQGQGASISNYQWQKRLPDFEESILHFLSNTKKKNGQRIANLQNNQANMGASLKNLEAQVNPLAHSMKESSSRSSSSDMVKTPKDYMAITLRIGKKLGDLIRVR